MLNITFLGTTKVHLYITSPFKKLILLGKDSVNIGDENCLQIKVWNSCKEIFQNKLSILFNFMVLNQFIDVRGDWDILIV